MKSVVVNGVLAVLLAAYALGAISCTSAYRLDRRRMSMPPQWPYVRGDIAGTGAREQATYGGSLNIVWERSFSGKPAGPLTVYHNTVVLPDVRDRVYYYETSDGTFLGKTKLNGLPQTGIVVSDSIAFVGIGPDRSELRAVNLLKNRDIWERDFRDANPGPILVDERLVASSRNGLLRAYALTDGGHLWSFSEDALFTAAPSFADGRLFQPVDNGVLVALDSESGEELYRRNLASAVVNPVAIDRLVFVAQMDGQVTALEPAGGNTVWERTIEGPVWVAPTVGNGRVVIGNSRGHLMALDAQSGRTLWTYDAQAVIRAPALIVGGFVVAGTQKGRLAVLRADDGAEVASVELDGAIKFPPVTDGHNVYVATQNGRLYCFGDANETPASRTGQHAGQGVRASLESQ